MNFSVDELFPSETNRSGTRGKNLNIETLFTGTHEEADVIVDMSYEVLLDRKIKRRKLLQKQYMKIYKFCWDRIDMAEKDGLTEIIFEVLPTIPQFPEYNCQDCLNIIQNNLRDQYMDTIILEDGLSIYISWADLEANKNRDQFSDA